ncbi:MULTISPECIES: protein-disulfide reductase DsbD N-terminal domain-containing protein [Noviherbaspirillum]|uniref:protein-disulfide reductase DsbD N-terminal domain-containing protein n=1 Tax=Noviherbaspirillum TaxID=1344552 RepID=UPI001CEF9140|nr:MULTISPECIES: protein-disulfide reductase DsbD N-terminal domain-containing protein [Noviherbaspirillum]
MEEIDRFCEAVYIEERAMKIKAIQAAIILTPLVAALTLPAHAQQSSSPGLQDKVKGLFSNTNEDELLEPDAAFKFQVVAKGTNALSANLIPAKGYYLYKQRVQFALKNANGVSINAVKLPPGEMKTDQIFGRTEVYKKAVPVELALNGATKGKTITLVASYQGCHEKLGVCYPPIEKAVNLVLP